ncbi:MAG: SDR family oxidoreductase [Eubacteriales bacterium]|nr:SDR family oxidoreductase [Eubacteriales bacterium]
MVHPLFDITGRKAVVAGGTRGLGHGMAEGLLEAGCEVVIIGSSARVHASAEEFRARGFQCFSLQADLAKREENYRAFDEAVEKLGGTLDILVTAHGIQRRCRADQFPMSDWDDVIAVNLESQFILCQQAAKMMVEKGYGKIITVSSMSSFFGGQNVVAYSAAKGGVAQMTKCMSNDLLALGVNVNSIAPGYFATDMNEALLDPECVRYKEICDRIPAHRWGQPEDMKGACLFLASHASDYLGGAILPVDGGYLCK